MSAPKVRTELIDGVLTITLADETNRNALSSQLCVELIEAFDRADLDPAVRVVVLTNEGRIFCAGADLNERSGDNPAPAAADPANLFGRIMRSAKPFVGKIAGHAVAGGMGLAAAVDLSVAVEDARFGFTEVRVGLAPAVISVVCLPKMRRADAASVFLRGNRFLAPEAVRLGLINECVPANELDGAVSAIVDDLLEGGPGGLAASKSLIANVPTMPAEEALVWAGDLSADCFRSDEGQEGIRAYLEKRPPDWSPRSST